MMTDMTPLVGFYDFRHCMSAYVLWHPMAIPTSPSPRPTSMVKHVDTCEAFQFGRGQPIYAKDRVYMPVSLGGCLFLIGSSVVDTSIPLLASNAFLEQLDTVVDLGKQRVFLERWMFQCRFRRSMDILQFQFQSFMNMFIKILFGMRFHMRVFGKIHIHRSLPPVTFCI